ncbi:MAG: hypothetical protein IPF88_12555 [Candidatus Microthrix sp.]|nr:hypothetical protein [Candidatus Microthrix sp.]MBK6439395.1 hypothetical protein [Candidatus Microthrix sp.]
MSGDPAERPHPAAVGSTRRGTAGCEHRADAAADPVERPGGASGPGRRRVPGAAEHGEPERRCQTEDR